MITQIKKYFSSETFFFTFCHYISFIFTFLAAIMIRRLLGPLTMGFFSKLMLFLQYGKFHHLGIINAMERDISYYRGENNIIKVVLIQKSVLAFIFLTAFHIGTILAIVAAFWTELQLAIPFIILLIFIETLIAYYQTILQSYKKFKRWGIITASMGSIDFLLKGGLTYGLGMYGLLIAMILSGIITLICYFQWSQCNLPFAFLFSWKEIKTLLKTGLPLLFFRTMYLLSQSVDRIIVLLCLGHLQLGLYSIAVMLNSFLTTMPKSTFRTLSPTILETFGRTKDIQSIKYYLFHPHQKFGIYFGILIGFIILGLPFGVHWVLPQFQEDTKR